MTNLTPGTYTFKIQATATTLKGKSLPSSFDWQLEIIGTASAEALKEA